ncbi:serine/threonine-protein kinase [Tessaracoccus rhinocerotis]|nr:serine/threonine-protein kinase [Tessaracoccus rhinocerotis]
MITEITSCRWEGWMERLRPGLVLADRYRLVGHVASGGMGQVWEVADSILERRVAMKIMHPHTRDEIALAERFRDEARFAAQLAHPNIVTVHDYIDHEGLSCLVMEFVDGPTLSELMASGPLPLEDARMMLLQLASALAQAHAAGIIHRDLKPANVLVSEAGAKLTDFGIARSIDGGSHTVPGQLLGTAYYLSPEQALGQPVGPATDMYGWGLLAHEMLTGTKVFDKGSPIATALAHVQDEPPTLPPGMPPVLESLVSAALAKEPEDRPTSALAAELLEASTGEFHATPKDAQDPSVPRRAAVDG